MNNLYPQEPSWERMNRLARRRHKITSAVVSVAILVMLAVAVPALIWGLYLLLSSPWTPQP